MVRLCCMRSNNLFLSFSIKLIFRVSITTPNPLDVMIREECVGCVVSLAYVCCCFTNKFGYNMFSAFCH